MYGLAGASAALLVGGGLLAFVLGGEESKPKASPSPKATPTPAPSAAPIACGGKLPDAAGAQKPSFKEAEDQKLNKRKTYLLRLQTSCGTIDIKLALDRSPKTANSVAFLARKGFYDGTKFHRVVRDFVLQGGDPKGDGTGGPGYKVTEAPPKDLKYTKGKVAMAKAGQESPGTSGSQFFIVSGGKVPDLPAEYALLGDVMAGIDVVEKINALQIPDKDGPIDQTVYIERATIVDQ